MNERVSMHGHWSSRMAFILAVTGSAVGLGNIWKFPYIAGENGGGLFVLLYLLFVFGIGLPVMMSEVLIGRRGRRNPVDTMRILGEEEAGQGWWQVVGWNGILAGFLILSFYSVIAGWSLAYVWKSMSGAFAGASAEEVGAVFADLTGSAPRLIAWHTVFMGMTIFVVARGVQYGLERAVRILMPALLFLLLVLFIYSARSGGFAQGWSFLFDFGHSELTWNGVLIALGHAFFTLSVGMGAVMAYGAYLPEGTPIATTTISVVFADTAIALLAGLVIFPIVFVNGLDPAAGPGLIFKTLPLAFGQMPGGMIFATIFFVLLSFAAWTSSIGLLEPAAAWAVERFNTTRNKAAWMLGVVIWAIGLLSALSFNVLSEVKFFKGNFFENIDYVGSNIMLPLGGLGITVFAGWVMCRNATAEELDIGTGGRYRTWRALARFVAPVGIALVFMNAIGLLSFG